MSYKRVLTAAMFIVYGVYAVTSFFIERPKAEMSKYQNLQGLLSGVMSLFFGLAIAFKGINYAFFDD